ncbi:MAG TPA: anhydro-N-acetylmuramic acid kinase [Phycisphaerae bacterium]|nr:anhydro-N-acetylmuramic acid kinase [Phycisphaerae bacterium]HOJ56655.1 anhydro-N-acetylmuramic acid kinase [Phycisphaerae bacterium]HOL28399.1 anhydro-N-acetylmuramic acid kinase [Phycisphaerae bacterium]HPP22835.1 anhydro-N-acetylmuramic acid kinase [Phycisphaerae bacterium]HPU34799.1 anhydro-N-acetylmuramic acid kinase [Phycisphaerae bacterium]
MHASHDGQSSRRTRSASVRRVIGLMSGTSADGVDAVVMDIAGRGERMHAQVVLHHHLGFPTRLRQRLLAVMAPAATSTEEIARLHAELGEVFARAALGAIRRLGSSRPPSLIGLAGQTVCHLPGRRGGGTVTLQLGDAARVAARTGLTVVSDFRQSDVAAGGFGAPLVPWTDWVLFRHPRIGRAVQNIGGIGNVTWIPPGARAADVVAFDTGPGNMIIDGLVALATQGRERFDRNGRRAARGRVLTKVLERWLSHPYFRLRPPKTTGREDFGRPFLERELPVLQAASSNPDDWIATATAFTARSIASSYFRYLNCFHGRSRACPTAFEVILCGGGAHNATLRAMLSRALASLPVEDVRGSGGGRSRGTAEAEGTFAGVRIGMIETYGISSQAKEALSFGILAAACMDGVPGNLPQVTGARFPAVLGRIIRPANQGSGA